MHKKIKKQSINDLSLRLYEPYSGHSLFLFWCASTRCALFFLIIFIFFLKKFLFLKNTCIFVLSI